MHYASIVSIPLVLCVSGCGLVLDLDPDDPNPSGGLDAGPRVDSGGGRSDGGAGEDGSVFFDAGSADASGLDATVEPGCGNHRVEDELGEECDDGNEADGDGCDSDCTYTCTESSECNDGNVCNGLESCDLATHTCKPGDGMSCVADACHTAMCDPVDGCVSVLIDGDGDGHASTTLGACGTDCNDSDPTVHEGAVERCDGIDHDCDSEIGDTTGAARCYQDADGDTFGDPSVYEETCSACEGGDVARAGDCADDHADVNPGQTAFFSEPYCTPSAGELCFDYNCDRVEEQRWLAIAGRCRLLSTLLGCTPSGWDGSVPACGVEGMWVDCEPDLLGCSASVSTRTQECR